MHSVIQGLSAKGTNFVNKNIKLKKNPIILSQITKDVSQTRKQSATNWSWYFLSSLFIDFSLFLSRFCKSITSGWFPLKWYQDLALTRSFDQIDLHLFVAYFC